MKAEELWFEFVNKHLCGLCGNTAVIDTRSTAISTAGVSCGIMAWCICPNGRAFKAAGARLPTRD